MQGNFISLLKAAQEGKYAIAAFNFDNLEILKGIIKGAEAQNAPVIVMATHSAIKYMGLEYVNAMTKIAIRQAKVPIVYYLDHCSDLNFINEAVDDHFQAIMYDGSQLNLSENIAGTIAATKVARNLKIGIEAEIGHVGGKEDDHTSAKDNKTNLEDLKAFISKTEVDALAVSIGNSHGKYAHPVNIDLNLLSEIKAITKNLPLVLHGSSGIPADQIKAAIKLGVCKVNFGTELKIANANSLRKDLTTDLDFYDARIFGTKATIAVQKVVEKNIQIVGANNKFYK